MTYPPPYEQQPGAQPTEPVLPSSSPPTSPYPTYLGPPAPPPRRRSNGPLLAVVIVLAVLLAGGTVTMCALLGRTGDPNTTANDSTRDPETPKAKETTPEATATEAGSGDATSGTGAKVVYEVTGTGTATIIYFKADGVTPVQAGEADLPWRQELRLESDAAFVSVNATRASGEGKLGCRITIDGKEVAKKSANGQYAIVFCSKLIL
jgi:hypothetical protein